MASLAAPSSSTPWYRRPHTLTLAAMAVVLASAFPLRLLVQNVVPSRRLNALLPRARAAGVPLQAKDLAVTARPGANGAPVVMRAIEAMAALSAKEWEALQGDSSGQNSDYRIRLVQPEARRAIRKAAPALELLAAASAFQRFDFGHKPENGVFELYPEFAKIKKLCRLATYSAYLHSVDQDPSAALADLRAAAATSRMTPQADNMIGVLVGIACDSIFLAGVEQCMANAKDADDLEQYARLVESSPFRFDAAAVARSEAYLNVLTAKNMHLFKESKRNDSLDVKSAPLNDAEVPRISEDRAALAKSLEVWAPIFKDINAAKGDQTAIRSAMLEINTRWQAVNPKPKVKTELLGTLDWAMDNEPPDYTTFFQAVDRDVALNLCMRAAAKALAFKAKTGHLPASIDEVAPGTRDPFTGESLRYIQSRDGFRIYSVGQDRVDDHGLRRQEAKSNWPDGAEGMTYDIVASYPPYVPLKPSTG